MSVEWLDKRSAPECATCAKRDALIGCRGPACIKDGHCTLALPPDPPPVEQPRAVRSALCTKCGTVFVTIDEDCPRCERDALRTRLAEVEKELYAVQSEVAGIIHRTDAAIAAKEKAESDLAAANEYGKVKAQLFDAALEGGRKLMDDVSALRAVLTECVEAMRLWGAEEDGIPEELGKACKPFSSWQSAKAMLARAALAAKGGEVGTHEERWARLGWPFKWDEMERKYAVPIEGGFVWRRDVAAVDAWIAAQAAKGGGR